jgi:hypothetical protein
MDSSYFYELRQLQFPNNIREICNKSQDLCLIGQYYNRFTTLQSYVGMININQYNEIPLILFQLYYVLDHNKHIFTHYDLHLTNIGVVCLPSKTHIDYEYHFIDSSGIDKVIRFKSKYIVKLLDYGRSYFHWSYDEETFVNSELILNEIEQSGFCPPLNSVGFVDTPLTFVHPRMKNESHDLMPLHRLKPVDDIFLIYPSFKQLISQVVYSNMLGTPEVTGHAYDAHPGAPILNVRDAHFKIKEYIDTNQDFVIDQNESHYLKSTSLGTLKVYGTQPMVFTPAVRRKERGQPSRFQMPDIPNTRL